jgi:hypothetical protein
MERKLASIRVVKELLPIKGADLIEVAVVDGWQCVVKKGEFKAGDMGVYFEIDSFLPIRDEFEFLRKSCFKKMGEKEGLRLRTIKLRGTISQGLILPMSIMESFDIIGKHYELGQDVTKLLEVEKYDPPIPAQLQGQIRGNFPSFIKKTDQERIQNVFDKYSRKFIDNNDVIIEQLDKEKYAGRIQELLDTREENEIRTMDFEATLKLDGTSCTYYVADPLKFNVKDLDEPTDAFFGHCSRNLESKEGDSTPWKIARDSKIKDAMIQFFRETGRSFAIQGELMGPGIQGNRENLTAPAFYLFDIWDIDNQTYVTPEQRDYMCEYIGVNHVPVLDTKMRVFEKFTSIKEILDFAEGKSINSEIREGIVFKSNKLIDGEIVSFKAISNKFLLKGGE